MYGTDNDLLWIEPWMAYHDVTIERDGQHSEHWDGQKSVAHQREERTQRLPMDPGSVVEERRGQRQVEAAEHQIRHAQVNDEHRCSIADLYSSWNRQRDDSQMGIY